MDTSNLPIRQYAADILAAVETNDVVVVIGETGSGKTTQLSQVTCQGAAAAVDGARTYCECSSACYSCRSC
jgi:ATP-dependent RNA helicase DHX8/PRP22